MKRILIEKKNGMFNLHNIYIQLRAAQDGVYEFMMKRVRKKRTINQNDWLWGGCLSPPAGCNAGCRLGADKR